jgi:hypothetical protein
MARGHPALSLLESENQLKKEFNEPRGRLPTTVVPPWSHLGKNENPVGQAFQPDDPLPSGWKA